MAVQYVTLQIYEDSFVMLKIRASRKVLVSARQAADPNHVQMAD